MGSSAVARALGLLRSYKSGDDLARFRNAFKEALSRATEMGDLDDTGAALLTRARQLIESWRGLKTRKDTTPLSRLAGGSESDASELPAAAAREEPVGAVSSPDGSPNTRSAVASAWAEWLELQRANDGPILTEIVEILGGQLPSLPTGALDLTQFVLACRDRHLLTVILPRAGIKSSDLVKLARSHPSEFYYSAGFDLLLTRKVRMPDEVWHEFARGATRPHGLMPVLEALKETYSNDRRPEADEWMVKFLANAPAVRGIVMQALLEDVASCLRLVTHLTLPPRGKRHELEGLGRAAVLKEWLGVCERAFSGSAGAPAGASIVLGTCQLLSAGAGGELPNGLAEEVATVTARVAEGALLAALKRAEGGDVSAAAHIQLLVSGDQLFRIVQAYVRALPVGARGEEDSPERVLRFERYQGRRDVIQGLLSASEDLADGSEARDAIEVALFNVGVRELGEPGEEVVFDVHLHKSATSGLLPGARAVVVRPGRRLGDDEAAVVLLKAIVKAV